MLKTQYLTNYLRKEEGTRSKVAETSEVEQMAWKQRFTSKRSKRSGDDLELPENFNVGRAIADGNCFFDSFKQGLEEQLGIRVSIEQLRKDCKEFARSSPPRWFIDAIANSHDNNGRVRSETPDLYMSNIVSSDRWGDPDIEGKVLCQKYNVRLHIAEKQPIADTGWIHQIVDGAGSRSVNNVGYNENNVIHIVNRGGGHFEPILRMQGIQHGKQPTGQLPGNQLPKERKHPEPKTQDFELLQLLIQEADSVKETDASTSAQQRKDFESFQARFQSYIDQIPSYLHSVKKAGFFPNFFLGSFSILLDTEIANKLNIRKIYFDFDGAKTLKVAVIKNGEIKSQKDVVDKVKLFVISESGSRPYTQEFYQGELKKVLGNEHYSLIENHLDEVKVKLIKINKENIDQEGIFVEVEDKKVGTGRVFEGQFTEIKKGLWNNPESDIARLVNSNERTVKASLRRVLTKVSAIHSKYKDSLGYGSQAREAAHHGFVAGVLNNFRYRYNLRVYLEQFAGRGYADIVLLARGPNRAPDSISIIIELKAGTGPGVTPDKALQQAEKYAQGFQPNVQRVLTTAEDILCVGVNLDYPSPISNIETKSREEKINPLFQDILKSTDDWDTQEIGKRKLKEQIKDNLERIYHTFPGTPEKGDNHYFSRFLLGQSLLLNEVEDLRTKFEKHIFIYDRGENIPTEIHPGSGRPQRPAAQKAKDKLSTGLDKSHAVVSMVLIPESTEKLVYVINIVEANRKDVLNKVLPLDRLNQKIGDRKIVELNLNFDIRYKSNFERYLTVEASDPVSLEQYNERGIDEFQGTFREVPYSDQLKEAFDRALDSQRTQSSSISEYNELFKKIGEGIFPFKTLINKEARFQAVLNGAFSHYSDLRLQESPETRALVLTEFQTGRGERIDMLVHGIKFADQGNAKEYAPIGLELKGPRGEISADKLKEEANDQITGYAEGVTYKTLTDGDEVKFIGVVFNRGAKDAGSLILTSEKEIPVKVVHSSHSLLRVVGGQCSEGRKKRNIGMACVDSRDEEDITKEEKERRIKELFDTEEMRERTKNIEFYDQFFKVSERMSKGEAIDQNIEEAFITKVKDINLDLIDPEIRDVVGEIKGKISEKEANKSEEIKDILTRSGVAEKISEAAKGVGFTYRKFLDDGAQNIINKINSNPEAMRHLNIIGRISGWSMQGMMYKNLIGDILSGNLEGVAINLGFIGGSNVLGKVANTVAVKGEQFISEGKLFLGKSLKAASPFLARATSGFIVYDLVNQVKAFKSGDKDAMAGIVGDSIALTVDAAEIGIEVAEVAGILSGVSSVTGPIGAGITAVVFIGTDIYLAVRTVEQEYKIIHLTGREKFKEGWRAFFHIKPEIEKLTEEKLANDHLVENAVDFLRQHTGIRKYFFPTGKLVDRKLIEVDLNNKVLLNERRWDIKWSRSRPSAPRDGMLFCLPKGDWESIPDHGAYICENAIGLSYSANRTGNYTLIDLGEGNDEVVGSQDSPNIFLVGNGDKQFTGGNKDDTFILCGSEISGVLNGGGGANTIDLGELELEPNVLEGVQIGELKTTQISNILGRRDKADYINYSPSIKYIDGRGGKDGGSHDIVNIYLEDCLAHCSRQNQKSGKNENFVPEMQIVIRPYTYVRNCEPRGDINYIVHQEKGESEIHLEDCRLQGSHSFLFNNTLQDIKAIDLHSGHGDRIFHDSKIKVIKVVFYFLSHSKTTVVLPESKNSINISYKLKDNTEIKIGNKGGLYALQSTDRPINDIIRDYPAIADRLNMTIAIQFQDEFIIIGHEKHEVMNNEPLRNSYLIGNGGENVYVILIPLTK